MPYALVDDGLAHHPKAKQTSDAALGLWLRGLTHAARYLTDGRLDAGFVDDFISGRGRGRHRAARELVDRGWWEPTDDGGYMIISYLEHQRSRAEVEDARARSRDRQRRSREQSRLPWNGAGVTRD